MIKNAGKMTCGSVNIMGQNMCFTSTSVTTAKESMNIRASGIISMEAGAKIGFHDHMMTIIAACEAKSIQSLDNHTLQVVDVAGVAHNYDMNSDCSYPS